MSTFLKWVKQLCYLSPYEGENSTIERDVVFSAEVLHDSNNNVSNGSRRFKQLCYSLPQGEMA